MGILEYIRGKLRGEPPLHPLDRKAAKRYVKQRLMVIFPEYRNDPEAIERIYREMSLEPRPGTGRGGETVFEVVLPSRHDLR